MEEFEDTLRAAKWVSTPLIVIRTTDGTSTVQLRLAPLTHNVLTTLKGLALPPELLMARPKRLRFLIFNTPGKLVHHARRTMLRLHWGCQRFSNWQHALRSLPLATG